MDLCFKQRGRWWSWLLSSRSSLVTSGCGDLVEERFKQRSHDLPLFISILRFKHGSHDLSLCFKPQVQAHRSHDILFVSIFRFKHTDLMICLFVSILRFKHTDLMIFLFVSILRFKHTDLMIFLFVSILRFKHRPHDLSLRFNPQIQAHRSHDLSLCFNPQCKRCKGMSLSSWSNSSWNAHLRIWRLTLCKDDTPRQQRESSWEIWILTQTICFWGIDADRAFRWWWSPPSCQFASLWIQCLSIQGLRLISDWDDADDDDECKSCIRGSNAPSPAASNTVQLPSTVPAGMPCILKYSSILPTRISVGFSATPWNFLKPVMLNSIELPPAPPAAAAAEAADAPPPSDPILSYFLYHHPSFLLLCTVYFLKLL